MTILHKFTCKTHGMFDIMNTSPCPVTMTCPACDADPIFNTDIDAGPYGLLGGAYQKCKGDCVAKRAIR